MKVQTNINKTATLINLHNASIFHLSLNPSQQQKYQNVVEIIRTHVTSCSQVDTKITKKH